MRRSQRKPVLSVSIPLDRRERFYASLAHFRQHAPFVTKSARVVQAEIEAARAAATGCWRCSPNSHKRCRLPNTERSTRGVVLAARAI
jgi:hypothetical protein